jgi:hypothetical protein
MKQTGRRRADGRQYIRMGVRFGIAPVSWVCSSQSLQPAKEKRRASAISELRFSHLSERQSGKVER